VSKEDGDDNVIFHAGTIESYSLNYQNNDDNVNCFNMYRPTAETVVIQNSHQQQVDIKRENSFVQPLSISSTSCNHERTYYTDEPTTFLYSNFPHGGNNNNDNFSQDITSSYEIESLPLSHNNMQI
jgi:hypothetical protein